MIDDIKNYTNSYVLLGDIMSYIKYLKTLIYILIPLLILNIFTSVLYYFNIISNNSINYLKLIMIAISMLIGGIYIGNKATKKGWLEGIKVGLEVIIILFVISYLAFDQGISVKTVIYYFILLASSTLGSMVGINKRKTS